jgi:steroid delta-isomerase-like uncharacterized protein/uncharacterized protein (TIGR02246 family)
MKKVILFFPVLILVLFACESKIEKQSNAIVDRLVKAFNTHDAEKIAELYAEDAVVKNVFGTDYSTTKGQGNIKEGLERNFRAFPDGKLEVENVLISGDQVAVELKTNSTFSGKLLTDEGEIFPTGERIETRYISVLKINSEGLIVRESNYLDGSIYTKLTESPLTGEESKANDIVRNLIETFNRHDASALAKLYSNDAIVKDVFGNDQAVIKGQNDIQEGMRRNFKAFPDSKLQIKNIVASGNKVVVELKANSTFSGRLLTDEGVISPTGKKFEVSYVSILQINRDGLIVAESNYLDKSVYASILKK